MKVALVTEGTYPIHPGGVADWCHDLIRGFPDTTFEVTALSGSGLEPATYDVPPNVSAVHRYGLWAPVRRVRPLTRHDRERFVAAYAQLVESMLRGGPRAAAWFENALCILRELAGLGSLTEALRSQAAVDVLVDVWSRRAAGADDVEALSLADALTMTDLIEHFLRPLQLPARDADLVHATANGPSMLVGLVTAWGRGTPVVLSEHGVYLRERLLQLRRSGLSRAGRAGLVRFFARLTELGYRRADAVLPVSEFNARWARLGGADAGRIRIVHNGVDPSDVPLLDGEPDSPTIVFAGRIDPLKDLETLIHAFATVRREIEDARFRLFGGVPAGNEAYAKRCADLVRGLGLDDAVTFEGPVNPVGRAFEAGHLVVLSSVSEGLPLTVIEAALSGRAVVATDVGGTAEAVGGGGVLVPAGAPEPLADACIRLLTDTGRRRALAAAGREHALGLFTAQRFRQDMDACYREAVGARVTDEKVAAP